MKQYRLIYSRLISCVFFLLSSFCLLFKTTTYSQVIHHRPSWPTQTPEAGPGPPSGLSLQNKTIPAVFFFGDSIVDTGNNNNLTTTMRCNFYPYGMDFPLGVATGRFCNGKVVSDYILSQGAQWLKDDIYYYTSKMTNSAASFVMQLYDYGARKIAVLGTPPLGCVPSQRTLKGGIRRDCAQDINYASQLFNAKLSITLDQLAKTLPNSKIIYIDIYSAFSHILENPADYGFEEIKKGCCGTGLLEVGPLCNRLTPFVCSNVPAHLFWDSFHPTQRFYKILTKILFEKYIHNLSE